MVVFADDAAGVEVLGHFLDHVPQFKRVSEVGRNRAAAEQGSYDVSADRPGGITVSGMVHTADNGILEGVPVLGGTVEGNGQGLMAP